MAKDLNDNLTKLILFLRKWRVLTQEEKTQKLDEFLKTVDASRLVDLVDEVSEMVKKFGL